ncbi:MAG: DUF1905 domain-containing protein [Actinomycetota bacterium]
MDCSDWLTFTAEVWLWPGESPWHFVSLPVEVAEDIRTRAGDLSPGFGTVPVEVRGPGVRWATSVFPDKESGTYLLPLKQQVRRQLGCVEGSSLTLDLRPRHD